MRPHRARRRVAAFALVVGVLLWHGGVSVWVAAQRQSLRDPDAAPARMEVTFVRELQPTEPPPAPSKARPTRPPVAPERAPEPAASAPILALPSQVDSAPDLAEPAPATSMVEAPQSAAPPDLALDLSLPTDPLHQAFEWPPSTRLRYALKGHYRGPVEGSASVEWIRQGSHYQVHLDVVIGATFAPLITRQMSSDGTLGPQGLSPQRYDERTRLLLRDPFQATIRFDGDVVHLPRGRQAPRPQGVQDAVSQFVQLTWMFIRDPSWLHPGRLIDLPLALPGQVSVWTYEVQPAQTLWTPTGPIEAVPLRPRRPAIRGGDLVAEPWFAPSLQYLPVRIVIRQDEQTYIDLTLEALPQQATSERPDAPHRVVPKSAAMSPVP